MISTLTQKGAKTSLEALHIGAVDYVSKPQTDVIKNLEEYAEEITAKVKTAAGANLSALTRHEVQARRASDGVPATPLRGGSVTGRVIAIGASTGGTEAIAAVLSALPDGCPPVLVAQHIPEMFSRSFSERVDRMSALRVREATDGEPVEPGNAYVAPGNYHLSITRAGGGYACVVSQEERVNRHRPSVDVLFESVARAVAGKGVGVMLTGMGSDGARGLKAMREAGARTFAQDKATSVVWGMPGSAVELGAVEKVLPLQSIANEIVACVTV